VRSAISLNVLAGDAFALENEVKAEYHGGCLAYGPEQIVPVSWSNIRLVPIETCEVQRVMRLHRVISPEGSPPHCESPP
jgi:hypothetical protein